MEQEIKKVKVGDVFYTSWGYDQTNYDYVVVVEISPSGKTAICQLAKANHVGYSGQCNKQKPKPEGYGYKFRLQIRDDNLVGSYPYCSCQVTRLEEGEKPSMRRGYFSIVHNDDVFYETDSQFGH